MAFGWRAGAETRSPMGTAIVRGMLTSTVLTWIIVPVVYSLLDDLAVALRRVLGGRRPAAEVPMRPEAAAESALMAGEGAVWGG